MGIGETAFTIVEGVINVESVATGVVADGGGEAVAGAFVADDGVVVDVVVVVGDYYY